MPGVPRELVEHTLNIDPKFKPVKQFLRRFNEERRKAIGEEVPGSWRPGLLLKFFILSGWLTHYCYLRRMALGVYVWITRT